jgi:RNA methyltransferase, TrmH family
MARLKRSGQRTLEPAGASRLVALARDLQRRRGRERRALFLAEGVRAVEEVIRAKVAVKGALVSPQLDKSPRGRALLRSLEPRGGELVRLSERDLAAIAGTDTPQGILVIAEVPPMTLSEVRLQSEARVLLLDAIQDPGNAGTMLRTSAALGAAAALALPGTVDLWNPKVVRGAMGAHFQLSALHCELAEVLAWLDDQHVDLWVMEGGGEPIHEAVPPPRLALAVGNEGAGVSQRLRQKASRRVAIPIEPRVESLNAAVAAGIALYALRARAAN